MTDLPILIRELEELVGLTAALEVVAEWGGQRVYIPERLKPEHSLVRLLGDDAAAAVSARYSGEHLFIPKCAALMRAERDRQIRERRANGESLRALAAAFDVTMRHVCRIVAAEPSADEPASGEPKRQLKLF